VRADARVGVGALARCAPAALPAGTVALACGRGGYVGLVRLPDGRLDVAAALDASALRAAGGAGALTETIVRSARLHEAPELSALAWHGTPLLTRTRARVATHRAFVLGDAAGCVEPFTGEGIGWALASAEVLAPIAAAAALGWTPGHAATWDRARRRVVTRRQRACRGLARLLRHPRPVAGAIAALGRRPTLGARVLARLQGPAVASRVPVRAAPPENSA
jgi:flavin-dependent dehydrogenase